MNYEKSCGAIIFKAGNEIKYLIIFNKKGKAKGHWGFPKGHVEKDETELQTAEREILEETGLTPAIDTNFRVVSIYSPKPGIKKDAVYFLAKADSESRVTIQESELASFKWCSLSEACSLLTYDAELLKKADKYLKEQSYSAI